MMPFKNVLRLYLLLCCLAFSLLACDLIPSNISGTPETSPTQGTSDNTQLNVWYKAAPGVEVRYEDWKSPGNNEDTATIVRFDLQHVALSVAYQPTQPLLMSQWMQKEHATAIINGGYFDSQNTTEGLLVSNGQAFGTSYHGFGGMLSVNGQGQVNLRSLSQHPYDPNNEQVQQATQSSPMLILPGGRRTQFSANAASSRRSVVAMDKQGRLLLITSPGVAFSLDELADLLVSSDLSINVALNLDGGASTGLYVNAGSQHVATDSLTKLPIVIVVKAK